MFNGFTATKEIKQNADSQNQDRIKIINDRRYKNKTEKLASLSSVRREEWIIDSTYTEGFNTRFYSGAIPLINPNHHIFRDTERSSRGFSPSKSEMNDTQVVLSFNFILLKNTF